MNTKTILFIIGGLGLLAFLVHKLQPGETQVISQIIPVGSVDNNSGVDSRVAFEANKTAAFTSLLGLGQSQQASEVQLKNIGSQLDLENVRAQVANAQTYSQQATNLGLADIAASVQSKLGQYDYEKSLAALNTQKDIAAIEANTQTTLGGLQAATEQAKNQFGYNATLAGYANAVDLTSILSKTDLEKLKLQTESEAAYNTAYFANVLQQIQLNTQAQKDRLTQQIATLADVGNTYRNQSLERQGTILNAFSNLFTGSAPYNYQAAFGGPRAPTLLQQLQGLASSLLPQGIGGFFGI